MLKFDKNVEFECVEEAELYGYGTSPSYMLPERSRASVLFDSFTKHPQAGQEVRYATQVGLVGE